MIKRYTFRDNVAGIVSICIKKCVPIKKKQKKTFIEKNKLQNIILVFSEISESEK